MFYALCGSLLMFATNAYAQGFGSITGSTTGNTSVSGVADNTGTEIQTTESTVDVTADTTVTTDTSTEVEAESGQGLWWLVFPTALLFVLYRTHRLKLRTQL